MKAYFVSLANAAEFIAELLPYGLGTFELDWSEEHQSWVLTLEAA